MNEKLIENIVSDCGYEALGLYSYLYSIRDKKYNISVISKYQIANVGAYFDNSDLLESINELKEFGYLRILENMYLFPKTEDYKDLFVVLNQMNNEDDTYAVFKSNDEMKAILLKIIQSNYEDQEIGMNKSELC